MTKRLLQAGVACAFATFLPAASCDGGDVNQYGCPDDETCSPKTEEGLHFVGTRFGEPLLDFGEVKTIAHGGTQTVRLEIGDGDARRPFALGFAAELAGPAHVESQTGNVLVLRGDPGGPAFLRIVDPRDDDALFDRVRVDSAPLATLGLSRALGDFLAGTPSDDAMLFAAGGIATVALAATDGRALVDDSMRLGGEGVAQVAWDQAQIGNLAPGMHVLTASAAGRTEELRFQVVAGPDRVARLYGPDAIELGSAAVYCYGAMLGDRYVHVGWSIQVGNASVEPTAFGGCVSVTARASGTIQIHATGGALSIDETIAVTPPARARTLAPELGSDRGERGQLVRSEGDRR